MSGFLFLVGLRGSGKTSVGRALSARLGLPFHDADAVLESRVGKSISALVADGGEPAFRDWEERVLADLIAGEPSVIATGGGGVLRESNRRRMRGAGKVVWLTAPVDVLWQRICADPTTARRRPDLLAGGRAEIEQLSNVREPLYRECADLTIDSSQRSPDEIAGDILLAWSTSFSTTP